jgi:hypothetical protein
MFPFEGLNQLLFATRWSHHLVGDHNPSFLVGDHNPSLPYVAMRDI